MRGNGGRGIAYFDQGSVMTSRRICGLAVLIEFPPKYNRDKRNAKMQNHEGDTHERCQLMRT